MIEITNYVVINTVKVSQGESTNQHLQEHDQDTFSLSFLPPSFVSRTDVPPCIGTS